MKRIRSNPTIFLVLGVVSLLFLMSATGSLILNLTSQQPDWKSWLQGLLQNFSSEMMGGIITFVLFTEIIGKREEKEHLLRAMASEHPQTAQEADKEAKSKGLLYNGACVGQPFSYSFHENAEFEGTNFEKAQFLHAHLKGVNFIGAHLKSTLFGGADLQGALLDDANLQSASLWGANLADARFDHTQLQGVDFMVANLAGACIYEANLQGAKHLTDEQLAHADELTRTIMPDGVVFEEWVKSRPEFAKLQESFREKRVITKS